MANSHIHAFSRLELRPPENDKGLNYLFEARNTAKTFSKTFLIFVSVSLSGW